MEKLNLINISEIPQSQRQNSNRKDKSRLCNICNGKGHINNSKCNNCEGYGIIPHPKFNIQSFKYSGYLIAVTGGDKSNV